MDRIVTRIVYRGFIFPFFFPLSPLLFYYWKEIKEKEKREFEPATTIQPMLFSLSLNERNSAWPKWSESVGWYRLSHIEEKKFYKSSYEIFDCENRFWRYSWLSLMEKKEKKRRNIVRMLRVTEARVNICINSLFVRRPNAAYENKKKREKNKNLKKAHVHALNKRPIFTFGFAENVDGWISNRTSRVVNEDCSFPCNCYRI